MDTAPRRWEDDTGRVRWQPVDNDGRTLWHNEVGTVWVYPDPGGTPHAPVLHRWQWMARLRSWSHERDRARRFRPAA